MSTGRPHIWALMKNVEIYRPHLPFSDKSWIRMVVASHAIISEQYYELAAISFPMRISYDLSYVGKSSLAFRVLVNPALENNSSSPLVDMVRHYAIVDRNTRKPLLLPDDDVQLFKMYCQSTKSVNRVTVPPRPVNDCHITKMKTTNSDLDHLQHVNNASLYRMALNGIYNALTVGMFKQNSVNEFQNVKQISAVNIKEMFAGQYVNAYTWKSNHSTYCCELECDGAPTFRCSVNYN